MLFPSQIKNLLRQYKISPKKFMGQNFLISQKVVHLMLAAAEIKKTDIILEIGPGLGALTQFLVESDAKIIAVEKDRDLVKALKERFHNASNLKVIAGDIRSYNRSRNRPWPVPTNYKIVANLPYYLTAPIIRQFLEAENPPTLMVLLVQKEVAQRICSQPPKMNLLAVSVQVYAKPQIIAYVNQKSFWPRPEVAGAIIKIVPVGTGHDLSLLSQKRSQLFKIIKAGFSHPRKQLAGNLSQILKIKKEKVQIVLKQLGLNPLARAENLTIKQWLKLVSVLLLD